jgi:hypothetical protein
LKGDSLAHALFPLTQFFPLLAKIGGYLLIRTFASRIEIRHMRLSLTVKDVYAPSIDRHSIAVLRVPAHTAMNPSRHFVDRATLIQHCFLAAKLLPLVKINQYLGPEAEDQEVCDNSFELGQLSLGKKF